MLESALDLAEFEAAAEAVAGELVREFLPPPPVLTVTQWAEQHRRLSGTESAEPGPYRVTRTPYAREPQDCMSARSTVEEVVLMWAAQTSKTTVMLNCLGAAIGTNPGPVMIVWPTNTVAKRNSRQRISPLLTESPQLANKVRANRSRDKANTTLLKEFAGGILVIAGANSAADLRSTPVRDLYLDEVDAFPLDVDGDGDPTKLAEARQSTFARRRRLKTSTPTTRGFSRIEEAFAASDRCRFHVPCPHCGAFQPLEWGSDTPYGLKWNRDEDGAPVLSSVRYVCRENGCEIREHLKTGMLARGVWIAESPGAQGGKVRGFHLNGLYSPLGWLSWRTMAREWYEAMRAIGRGDVSLLRVFVNTRLAETFEEQGEKADEHALHRRAEKIPLGVVQHGMFVCTNGVDVQGDRLEVYTWAWGRGLERQLVDRRVIFGDPSIAEGEEGSPWSALTAYWGAPIPHASGQTAPLLATFVDSGGHHTQAVYAYARAHRGSSVFAVKGASQRGKAVLAGASNAEIDWRGQKIKRGVRLWQIGTDTAKAEIYGRLRLEKPGPGYVHLSADTPSEVFEQLTAERLVTRYQKGGQPRLEWVKQPGRRNEALDCAVYALAAAHYVQMHRWRDEEWDAWQRKVQPEQGAEALSGAALAPPQNTSTRRRRGTIGGAKWR